MAEFPDGERHCTASCLDFVFCEDHVEVRMPMPGTRR